MAIIRQALGDENSNNEETLKSTIGNILKNIKNNELNILTNQELESLDKTIAHYIKEYGRFYAWGGENAKGNYATYWERLKEDDLIFFGRGAEIKYFGIIHHRIENTEPTLSKLLWKDPKWKHIFLMKEVKEVSIPIKEFNEVAGYNENAFFRGISIVKAEIPNDEFLLKLILNSGISSKKVVR